MRAVADEVTRGHARVAALRVQLRPGVEAAARTLAQAEADLLAASG